MPIVPNAFLAVALAAAAVTPTSHRPLHASLAITASGVVAPQRTSADPGLVDTVSEHGNDVTWTGRLGSTDTLAVQNVNGALTIERAPGTEAEVIAHRGSSEHYQPRDIHVQVAHAGHRVTLCTVYPGAEGWECPRTDRHSNYGCHTAGRDAVCADAPVAYTIRVPAGVTLAASTIAGAVTGHDLASDVDARSIGGPIDVRSSGTVRASTMGRLTVAMGRADWRGRLGLSAGSALTVVLPHGTSADIQAQTSFGRIASDFPLTMEPGRTFGGSAEGTLGSGGRELALHSLGGTILLLDAGRHPDPEVGTDVTAYESPRPSGVRVGGRWHADTRARDDADGMDMGAGVDYGDVGAKAGRIAGAAAARAARDVAEAQARYWSEWGRRFAHDFARSFRDAWGPSVTDSITSPRR